MKKLLIFLLIVVILSLGLFLILPYFQKNNETKGFLRFKIHPLESIIKINNKNYQNTNGTYDIALNPNKYKLFISLPDYSFIEEEITINHKETLDLGNLFLFPNNWQKDNIVASRDIEDFYFTPDSNRIVYIEKNSDFQWYLFNRNTQEKELFWKSSDFPLDVIFSPKKTMIVNLGKNNWHILFLPKSLIQTSIPIKDIFKQALTDAGLKKGTTSLDIIQTDFYPQNDNYLILRTKDAIYLLDFLNREIEKIYDGEASPFILEKTNIYFLRENGVLTKISLITKQEQQISLFSFDNHDLEKTKIKKRKDKDEFLILESSQKTSFLKPNNNIPVVIGENIEDISFSLDEKEILLNLKNDKIEIYNIEQDIKSAANLYADIPAQWFLNNEYLLYLKNNALNISSIKENKIWTVGTNIKNNCFIYDSSINYIFYLSEQGIIKVSV